MGLDILLALFASLAAIVATFGETRKDGRFTRVGLMTLSLAVAVFPFLCGKAYFDAKDKSETEQRLSTLQADLDAERAQEDLTRLAAESAVQKLERFRVAIEEAFNVVQQANERVEVRLRGNPSQVDYRFDQIRQKKEKLLTMVQEVDADLDEEYSRLQKDVAEASATFSRIANR